MSDADEFEAIGRFVTTLFEEIVASPRFHERLRGLSTARLQLMRRAVDEVMAGRYAPLRGDGLAFVPDRGKAGRA